MPTRQELKELAQLRLKEAETLFDVGLYDGAAYLCGYVIEFALKARICKLLDLDDFPPPGEMKRTYTVHDFDQLLILAGLKKKLSLTSNREVFANWSIATPWKPEIRYQPKGSISKTQAEERLNAVRDKPNGVLTWIKKYW